MKYVKILKLDDLCKYYTCKGQLRKGIKKIYFSYKHPVIITRNKEEFINRLNWAYNLGVTKLIGIYKEPETWGNYCVYYKGV